MKSIVTSSRLILTIAAFVLHASFASAQALSPSDIVPGIDGVMQKGEYAVMQSVQGFWLGATLSRDRSTLTIGVAAQAGGWISAGLGSRRMNGAYIVIAYDKSGKQVISEDRGAGHKHSPVTYKKVLKSAVKTVNEQTVLEFSIQAADFIKGGKLQLILATSNTADLFSFHPKFTSLEIPVIN